MSEHSHAMKPPLTGNARKAFGGIVSLVLVLGLFGCGSARDGERADGIEQFLAAHWARPLAPQGPPPSRFSALETRLDPSACGACHVPQFADWSRSLHSRAMGPGVLGQLVDMPAHATEEHQNCLRCHAPLKEQADALVAAMTAGPVAGSRPAENAAAQLHEHGVTCAACHVRLYRRYGPARKDGSTPGSGERLPHDGWVSHAAFDDSRFCVTCHQFAADGFALNGKLLENTYEEWKASRYAREGKSCQSCHMPERRHLWRGIHDPDMVKNGVSIAASPVRSDSGVLSTTLTIANTGTGHYFPTYVTPQVVAEAYQEDARGRPLAGTRREHVIARQVAPDLSSEISDTRIPPDKTATFSYKAARHPDAQAVVLRVQVQPDAFYTALYRSLLETGGSDKGRRQIEEALKQSLQSPYTLYARREKLQ